MSKIVFIGDIHGETTWEKVVSQEKDADTFVFVGDYFDSYSLSAIEQIHNFSNIIRFKESSSSEVFLLIGNHDHHYFPEIGESGTSGFQRQSFWPISQIIHENRHHLQICKCLHGVLCTHAGVSEPYLDSAFGKEQWNIEDIETRLNDLFLYKPKSFTFSDMDYSYTGDHTSQSPIWIRPTSLMRASKSIRKELIQIVGHTKMRDLDVEDNKKWTNGRYYFIDTLNSCKKYLVLEDSNFMSKSVQLQ